jgi:membrane-bound serine protease (ClpP class)
MSNVKILSSLILLLLTASVMMAQSSQPSTGPATMPVPRELGRAAVIEVHGEINDFTARKLKSRVEKAQEMGIDTLILDLDTPGGAVGAAMDITRLLKQESGKLHTIAFVHPTAYSAGTMISLACDEIFMAPGGMLGDCAPILIGNSGLEKIEGAERAKMESPIVADFEDSAERHGYDPLLVRSFVQYQVVVYYLQGPNGERKFVDAEQYKVLLTQGWSPVEGVKNPVDDASTLLTFNDTTGVKLGISKGTYSTAEAVAAARGVSIMERFEATMDERVVELLGGAAVRGVLSLVFALSLYAAFQQPGTGVPEALAVVAGAVLFGVPLMTGYAGWIEMLLILFGIALLAFELFIIPGFGVAGITGLVMLLAGIVMTFVPSEAPGLPGGPSIVPQLQGTWTALKQGLLSVTLAMTASIILWVWLSRYLPSMPYVNRLVLSTSVGSTPDADADTRREAVESAWPTVGTSGVAVTDLRPGGVARFYDPIVNDGRNADVICNYGFVSAGTALTVQRREGPSIYVKPDETQRPAAEAGVA